METNEYKSFINMFSLRIRIFLGSWLLIFLISCNSKVDNRFEIIGKAVGMEGEELVLIANSGVGLMDTLGQDVVRNGSFQFSGRIISPVLVRLNSNSPKYFTSFWIEPTIVELYLDTSKVVNVKSKELIPDVKGSKEHELFKIFNEKCELSYFELKKEKTALANTQDPDEKKKINLKIIELQDQFSKKLNDLTLDFAKKNNSSFVAAYFMTRMINEDYASLDTVQSIMDKFTAEVKESSLYYKKNAEKLQNLKRIQPGMPAPDFTLTDQEGKEFSLSSLKGKIVLVDFWASWCIPCIAAIPALKKLYNEYKESGFEILGVANDANKEAWLKSIQKNSIPWKNVVDRFPNPKSQFGTSKVATLYSIPHVPTTILIDRSGIIVAKNLDEKELEEKIKDIL